MDSYENGIIDEKKEKSKKYTVKITYGHEKLKDCLENMLKAISTKIQLDI